MERRAVATLLAASALALAPSAASAGQSDVASTGALARATDVLVRAATPEVHRGLAAAERYASTTASQCPLAAEGSPQNHEAEQLDDEVIGAMTVTGYRVAAPEIATFARSARGLHWSNGRLTHAVKRFTTKLAGLSKLATPDVCGDIKAWAASGYTTVPASTVAFDQHYYKVDPEAEEVPLIVRLASPYATPAEVPVLHRVERLETKLGEAEAQAVESYSRLIMALNLHQ
jgi:hypothetical protein